MADDQKSVGAHDATRIQPTINGETVDKYRGATAIVDPFVEEARLRLAVVDDTYRLPTSNPAISDELVTMNATLTDTQAVQIVSLLETIVQQNNLACHHLQLLSGSSLTLDDMERD